MRIVLADDSVLIIESHPDFVSLCKQAEIIALCENGTKVLKNIRYLKPDMAIIDLQIPGFQA